MRGPDQLRRITRAAVRVASACVLVALVAPLHGGPSEPSAIRSRSGRATVASRAVGPFALVQSTSPADEFQRAFDRSTWMLAGRVGVGAFGGVLVGLVLAIALGPRRGRPFLTAPSRGPPSLLTT